MRVVWLTDLHLNFLPADAIARFLDVLGREPADAVLLTGDVAEAPTVAEMLGEIVQTIACPLYFVLGNHDFYFGSIAEVRRDVTALCRQDPRLVYLTASDVVELTPTLGLVGHDGWADARLGDYERSLVMMNDYRLIEELAGYNKRDRWPVLKSLGDAAAEHFRRVLPAALDRYPRVVLLTHVPPFREACWHEGELSNHEWMPHFTCQAVGQALEEVMRERPDRELTVLCGHTHSSGECWPLPNLHVVTGGAKYGEPAIAMSLEME